MARALASLAGAVVLLALAACGGGDGDGRLSQEEFVAQGNEICSRYQDELDAVAQPQSLDDVERYVEEGVPVVEQTLGELRELEPPEESQEQFDAMIAELEEAVEGMRSIGEAAAGGDEAQIETAAAAVQQSAEEGSRLAREVGLDACAE